MKRTPWWFIAFVVLGSTVALAADRQRTGGSSCCSLIWVGILVWIFRAGGADWLRAFGAAIFPGLFGWFIWKDEDLGTGSRWVALILAILQVLAFVAGIGVVLFAGAITRSMTAPLSAEDRRVLFEEGFMRRCTAAGTDKEVCACIVQNAKTLDDSDRKELAFDLQQRSLAKWLETTRTACQAGKPPPKEAPVKSVPTGKDDPLGLHPLSNITTEPPGATVFVNGEKRGTSPLDTPLNATERNVIRVEQAGFFPDSVERTPNANEHFTLSFTLKRGATVKVTSEPEGARVLVGGKEVLAKTPGTTSLLDADVTDVVVTLDGYQAASERKLLSAGENELQFTLVKGTKVTLKSTPVAAVTVDGLAVGSTPLDVWLEPKKKHELSFSAENHTTLTKTLKNVPKPTTVDVKLVDGERVGLQKRVAKAQARYDSINAKLEKLQAKIESARGDTSALEAKRAPLEREMEKAATELEKADAALKALDEERGTPPPKEPEE
ncbi:MAG: PEGA domain-containing protein [Archangium sp.]